MLSFFINSHNNLARYTDQLNYLDAFPCTENKNIWAIFSLQGLRPVPIYTSQRALFIFDLKVYFDIIFYSAKDSLAQCYAK